MPKSKGRKPARPAASLPEIARKRFTALVRASGRDFPIPATYAPTGPARECWTNAYENALRTGLRYAEGTCVMPNGTHQHAWNVTPDGTVVEVTTGYDIASDYRGFVLDMTEVVAVTNAWTGPRSSVLESGIASGVASPQAIAERIAAPGWRPSQAEASAQS